MVISLIGLFWIHFGVWMSRDNAFTSFNSKVCL